MFLRVCYSVFYVVDVKDFVAANICGYRKASRFKVRNKKILLTACQYRSKQCTVACNPLLLIEYTRMQGSSLAASLRFCSAPSTWATPAPSLVSCCCCLCFCFRCQVSDVPVNCDASRSARARPLGPRSRLLTQYLGCNYYMVDNI